MAKYEEIQAAKIPAGTRFDVPGRHQGQIVTISYGGPSSSRGEEDDGAPFKKILDGADGEVDPTRRKLALAALARLKELVNAVGVTIANPGSSAAEVVAAIEWAAEVVLAVEAVKPSAAITQCPEMTPSACEGCSWGPGEWCPRYPAARIVTRYRLPYWSEPAEPGEFEQVLAPSCYDRRGVYRYHDTLPANAVDPVLLGSK